MRVHLSEAMFARHEAELLAAGDIAVTTFRHASGVAALRIREPARRIDCPAVQGSAGLTRGVRRC